MDETLAQAKLLARLHDPAEKALVLLRDPAGHEGGTSRTLREELFGNTLPDQATRWVKKADWWASAADRPQFPKGANDGRYPAWSQVRFAEEPVIRHPLTGEALDLRRSGGLAETDIHQIKAQSLAHFRALIQRDASGHIDWHRTLLAFWRFGPEIRRGEDLAGLGELWRRLPADTRTPDHTIWDHLDLVSGLTGAFQADQQGHCALLHLAIGPVQDFIAAARTTSDLWAGSHLLARLAWEAMRVVCERLGPDAILFPSLRGVPQVDLWLVENGLDVSLFDQEDWHERIATDANPLFSASLPNRFLAIVPASMAEELATAVEDHLRAWIAECGRWTVEELLKTADFESTAAVHAYSQMSEQLDGFPEVHWSVVQYDELTTDGGGIRAEVDTTGLRDALNAFLPELHDEPGFLGSEAWSVLQRPVEITDPAEGQSAIFYRPNPGVLYPAIYDLGERTMGAAKAVRPFKALKQCGYRCSLTGETEWLTTDPEQLKWSPGQRRENGTLWTGVAKERPAWARKEEHLGGLAAIKRLWPNRFCEEIQQVLGADRAPQRFVVSTHTMALSTSLGAGEFNGDVLTDQQRSEIDNAPRAALPYSLARRLHRHPEGERLARLPSWLDAQRDREGADADAILRKAEKLLGAKPETYYALVLMDGDSMGKWLSGDPEFAIRYIDALHPKVAASLEQRFQGNAALQAYLNAPRAVSPGRHIAISGALNDFSGVIARWIVEEQHGGRLLYAGGDDLMAMLPTSDLLSAMQALRFAYSGVSPASPDKDTDWQAAGFIRRKRRIHVCMGKSATASMGAVVVHHQMPLRAALEELRSAEQRAKTEGGRDAFSLSVLKRSGGALRHTARWSSAIDDGQDEMSLILKFAKGLREQPDASRRAAYNIQNWLRDLPEPSTLRDEGGLEQYLESVLHFQFVRQKLEKETGDARYSRELARLGVRDPVSAELLSTAAEIRARIANLTGIGEFFARETRRGE